MDAQPAVQRPGPSRIGNVITLKPLVEHMHTRQKPQNVLTPLDGIAP